MHQQRNIESVFSFMFALLHKL